MDGPGEGKIRGHLAALWWWSVVVGVTVWATWPLLTLHDRVFSAGVSGDWLRGAWLYDFTARTLADRGRLPGAFTDFGWPVPIGRSVTLPNVVDAAALAPLSWLFDWPRQINLVMAAIVAVNALGLGWLARAAGCRGVGIALAGGLGAVMWPVWRELHMGRLNVAWCGLAFAATAALVQLVRAEVAGGEPWPRRGGRWVLAVGLGAGTLTVFPPWGLILAPLGLALLWPEIQARPGRAGVILVTALLLGVVVASPELKPLLARATRHKMPCSPDFCPKDQWFVYGRWLAALEVGDGGLELPNNAAPLGAWILAPLALGASRRGAWALLLTFVAGLALVTVGPCPVVDPPRLGGVPTPWSPALTATLWCKLEPLHDFGRLLAPAMAVCALLAGIGVEALGRRNLPARIGAGLLAALALTHAAWMLREATYTTRWWHQVPVPTTATFLTTAEPGPVAELPWDEVSQYLSVLEAPGSPRVNPVVPQFGTESRDLFIRWLDAVARGQPPPPTPTPAEVQESGVRWVFHDRARCGRGMPAPASACGDEAIQALAAALGPPRALSAQVSVWDLSRAPQTVGTEP